MASVEREKDNRGWTRREFLARTAIGAAAIVTAPLLSRFGAAETKGPADIASELDASTARLLESSPHNRVPGTDAKVYGAPIFAVASANDPLWRRLKEVVGRDHHNPEELLPGAKSVIVWFTPYTAAVSKSNYGKEAHPDLWERAHEQGVRAAELVRRHVQQTVDASGAHALVMFHDKRYRNGKLVSNWSERHIAWIAGLGTFGLHKNLITAKGCSGRLDTVVVDREFATTKRTTDNIYGNCINCLSCVKRCPVGAIRESGKSIPVCARYVLAGKADPNEAVCGKCLTQIPCENCIPKRA